MNSYFKLRLLENAKKAKTSVSLKDVSFIKQNAFITDPCKLKAALCTRRAGKSFGAGLYLCQQAIENPGASLLYVALTRESAKRIMFKDVLKVINRKYGLGAKFSEFFMTMAFPNGAVIYCAGADSDQNEMSKLYGQKYKLVVIDESASFRQDLKFLVHNVLEPAIVDLQGTIVLIGTPSSNVKSYFHEITSGLNEKSRWSVHKWTAFDNPYIRESWSKHVSELLANNPLIVETPWYKQNYLGHWVIETDKMVYRFERSRNEITELPKFSGEWQYVLGVDLGYNDPTAFTVVGYNKESPNLYIIESSKQAKMDITDVANNINKLRTKYSFHKFIVDGANKQAVEEIKNRFGIPLESAEKQGKSDFIEIMNSDFIQGKIKVLDINCALMEEWENMIWDDKGVRKVEHSACENHLADATLYAWRYCYNYLFRTPEVPIKLTQADTVDLWWEEQAQHIEKKDQEGFWDKDWS